MFNILKKKKIEAKEDREATAKIEKAVASEADYEKEAEKNASIHVMPKKFHLSGGRQNNAKKTGVFIIVGGAVLLIIVSVLLYFYLTKWGVNKPVANIPVDLGVKEEKKEEIKLPEIKEEKKIIKGPKESYLEMKADFDKAVNFNDFLAVINKYGSKSKVAELEKHKQQIDSNPALTDGIIALIKENIPKFENIDEIKEELVTSETANLSLSTKDLSAEGMVKLILEDDVWKLESESWKEIIVNNTATTTEVVVYTKGLDSDADGLTDKEEVILGTNINKADSDADGHSDSAEVNNFYNPAGAGKLDASALIKKYNNKTYGYGLFYPSNWLLSKVDDDDSVIVQSGDNHLINIIVQPNTKKQNIDEWFKTEFNEPAVNDANRIKGNGWDGIKNDSGLILYLADVNYIYIITYNPGESNTLEYSNIFNMMIKSFSVKK